MTDPALKKNVIRNKNDQNVIKNHQEKYMYKYKCKRFGINYLINPILFFSSMLLQHSAAIWVGT